MCYHQRLVFNRYTGRSLYANCGKCEACRQAKAEKQASRIRSHKPDGLIPLFVHLTYMNECVPYILKSELLSHPTYCNVYRDYDRKLVRSGKSSKNRVLKFYRRYTPLTEVEFVDREGYGTLSADKLLNLPELQDTYNPRPTTLPMSGKVGIIYYKDVQNFFKKLKLNLIRLFKFSELYDYKVSFYSVAEYGGEKFRPHFHLLIWCKRKDKKKFIRAIAKSWTFAYQYLTRESIEVAIDAASYVASYVNKSAEFPAFFEENSIKQKHSYSQGFGNSLRAFRLDALLEKVRSGNLVYDREVTIGGVPTILPFVYPKYVISRYFPKCKGFSRLSNGTIHWLFNHASKLRGSEIESYKNEVYQKLIDCCKSYNNFVLFSEDLHKISTLLVNKILLCDMSPSDYAHAYTATWTCYNSTLYRNLLEHASPLQQWQCYDNIADYFSGDVRNDSLDDLMFEMPKFYHYETDVNKFVRNVQNTERLQKCYFDKLQQHEVISCVNQQNERIMNLM